MFAILAALLLVVPALAVALARPTARGERSGEAILLAYPKAWRVAATAQLAVPVLLALLAVLRRDALAPGAAGAQLAVAAFLFLVAWVLRIEVAGVRHALTRDGVVRGSPWTRRTVIAWSELARVRWSDAGQVLVLEARDGRRVRLSPFLSGLGELSERLTARGGLPPDALGAGVPERLAKWVIALDGR